MCRTTCSCALHTAFRVAKILGHASPAVTCSVCFDLTHHLNPCVHEPNGSPLRCRRLRTAAFAALLPRRRPRVSFRGASQQRSGRRSARGELRLAMCSTCVAPPHPSASLPPRHPAQHPEEIVSRHQPWQSRTRRHEDSCCHGQAWEWCATFPSALAWTVMCWCVPRLLRQCLESSGCLPRKRQVEVTTSDVSLAQGSHAHSWREQEEVLADRCCRQWACFLHPSCRTQRPLPCPTWKNPLCSTLTKNVVTLSIDEADQVCVLPRYLRHQLKCAPTHTLRVLAPNPWPAV